MGLISAQPGILIQHLAKVAFRRYRGQEGRMCCQVQFLESGAEGGVGRCRRCSGIAEQANRLDIDFALDPFSTFPGHPLLLKFIDQVKPRTIDDERLLLGFVWIETPDEGGFAKQEI